MGYKGAGKTAIASWLARKEFQEEYIPTVGMEFSEASCVVQGRLWNLQLWDSAGKREYTIAPKIAFEGAALVVIVLDLSCGDAAVLNEAHAYAEDVRRYFKHGIPILVIGNKEDLERKLPREDVADFICSDPNMRYMELTPRNGHDEDLRNALFSLMVQGLDASSAVRVD